MTYTITLPEGQTKTYQQLRAATEFANAKAVELSVELEVVETESETVAHVATPVQGRQFHPFERVETPKFSALHIEGYRPAYTRKRIEAVVYRSLDNSHWLVRDGRTGGRAQCANTTETRHLLTEMRNGRQL